MALRNYMSFFIVVAILTGCQPARDQKRSRIGRTRAADSGNFNATNTRTTNGTQGNKTWGEVVTNASNQTFMQELSNFTAPSLNGFPDEDRLGNVSGQSGQSTGIRFYGNAITTGSGGSTRSFEPGSMMIHVEIYDDKTGQTRSDGKLRAPVVIEIAPDIDGWVGGGGTLSGSQVNLYLQDQYGVIRMAGNINGSTFSGNFGYCTGEPSYCSNTNNTRMLGQFNVDTCGFFQCN